MLNNGRAQHVGKEIFGIDRWFGIIVSTANLKAVCNFVLDVQHKRRQILQDEVSFSCGFLAFVRQ